MALIGLKDGREEFQRTEKNIGTMCFGMTGHEGGSGRSSVPSSWRSRFGLVTTVASVTAGTLLRPDGGSYLFNGQELTTPNLDLRFDTADRSPFGPGDYRLMPQFTASSRRLFFTQTCILECPKLRAVRILEYAKQADGAGCAASSDGSIIPRLGSGGCFGRVAACTRALQWNAAVAWPMNRQDNLFVDNNVIVSLCIRGINSALRTTVLCCGNAMRTILQRLPRNIDTWRRNVDTKRKNGVHREGICTAIGAGYRLIAACCRRWRWQHCVQWSACRWFCAYNSPGCRVAERLIAWRCRNLGRLLSTIRLSQRDASTRLCWEAKSGGFFCSRRWLYFHHRAPCFRWTGSASWRVVLCRRFGFDDRHRELCFQPSKIFHGASDFAGLDAASGSLFVTNLTTSCLSFKESAAFWPGNVFRWKWADIRLMSLWLNQDRLAKVLKVDNQDKHHLRSWIGLEKQIQDIWYWSNGLQSFKLEDGYKFSIPLSVSQYLDDRQVRLSWIILVRAVFFFLFGRIPLMPWRFHSLFLHYCDRYI